MAEVDGEVNLVMLRDVEDALLVLHVHRHKLVANFWRVLSVVHRAEELSLDVLLKLDVAFKFDSFTLNFLAPAILVEALSEKDHVSQDSSVVVLVNPVAHPVEVQSKDLVHKHVLAVFVGQAVVVSLPLLGIGGGWQLLLLWDSTDIQWVVHLIVSYWVRLDR